MLTDVVMPQMQGPELVERLHHKNPELAVLDTRTGLTWSARARVSSWAASLHSA